MPGESQFETYEDYLDSHITETDTFYLEDRVVAQQLVELAGLKGEKEILSREAFECRKRESSKLSISDENEEEASFSVQSRPVDCPLVRALKIRESQLKKGTSTPIAFIRATSAEGHEISGYIDIADRLKKEGYKVYLENGKSFIPCKEDLSFYDHSTGAVETNPSPNFHVVEDNRGNLLFKSTADEKVINVKTTPDTCGENFTRIRLQRSSIGIYLQIVLFEHYITNGV